MNLGRNLFHYGMCHYLEVDPVACDLSTDIGLFNDIVLCV